jgi:hypothetical protein
MALVGGASLGLLNASLDLNAFLAFDLSVVAFIAPGIIGFSIGVSRIPFKYSLLAGFGTIIASIVVYFGIFSICSFPAIFFHGELYPPDPGQEFIIHFMFSSVLLLFGVVLGGFFSGE